MHKYLSRAVITPEGIKNFQKQKPTAHRSERRSASGDSLWRNPTTGIVP